MPSIELKSLNVDPRFLESKGYKVIAPDLPSEGDDTSKLAGMSLSDDV